MPRFKGGGIDELENGQIIREGSIQNVELRDEFGARDMNSITELIDETCKERDKLTQEASNYIMK